MKRKLISLITALSIICAIFSVFSIGTYAENTDEEAFYICVYYDEAGILIDTKKIEEISSEKELERYINVYAPDNAAKARLYRWNTSLQPVGAPIITDYIVGNMSGTFKAPNVTSEMCTAQYWQNKENTSEELVMSENKINALNRAILDTAATNTFDLAALPGEFNGRSLADSLAGFTSPTGLYIDGKSVEESYYENIRNNIKNADVTENMQLKYGIAVNRTVMKAYPYEEYLSDDPSDPEWDNLVSTAVYVNEPLAVYFATADGKFSFVKSICCSGWVATEDIAVCADKMEWEKAAYPENILVVTGEKVYLEPSADADLSEKLLTMGTVLELVEEYPGKVAYRLPWNNYVVKMPARNEDGSFYQKNAMIPANRDVNVGYLPYTTSNVISQAFKSLGNRYGWGGMMNSQDCSAYVREVYKCFGLDLPRNTTWQASMPVDVTVMSNMTNEEKTEFLNSAPSGTILQFPGHEMIYLGEDNGLYYTINDVSSLVSPAAPEDGIIRPRGIVVNDLSTLRAKGTTWLDNLSYAIVIK